MQGLCVLGNCVVLANLSPDSHFSLERRPGLEAALRTRAERVEWLSIYDFERICTESGVDDASAALISKTATADVLLVHKEILEIVPPGVLKRISAQGPLVVGFLGDEEWALEETSRFLPAFDISVVYSGMAMDAYSRYQHTLLRLPVGASFSEQPVSQGINEDIDVLFIGRPYNPRPALMRFLVKEGVAVRVFGSEDWKRAIPDANYGGFLPNDEYNSTLARSKIILALMEAPGGLATHINAKVFDAAKAGKLAIATRYPPFETDYGLREGESIVTYGSPQELVAKIQEYLGSPVRRRAIGAAMSAALREGFDYSVLYAQLLDRIDRMRSEGFAKNNGSAPTEILPAGWRVCVASQAVTMDTIVPALCRTCLEHEVVVIDSVYRGRVIRKRLPVVDASSVLIGPGARSPLVVLGLVWCTRRAAMPKMPLNIIHRASLAVKLLFAAERVLDYLQQVLRKHRNV
jgi:hypothetical protein